MEINTDPKPEKKFKNFDETYTLCSFSLAFAFMYPNRTNVWRRGILITLIIALCGGQLFWFISYSFNCLYTLDIYNFSRNMSLAIVLLLFFIKTYYAIFNTQQFSAILRQMTKDLLNVNDLTEEYQKICQSHIDQGKIGEWTWLWLPTVMSCLFPFYAGISMTSESIKTDDFTRVMVHDMDMVYVRDIQDDWPFFHLYFAYNCVQCVVLVPNFCGFDGVFCIVTTHLRMKFKLMIQKLREAFSETRTHEELKGRVIDVIVEHQEALAFYNMIQDFYGPWLFFVFMLTSFMISFNLYQLYLLQKLDAKCILFGTVGVCHIYFPCYFASALAEVGDEVGSEMYKVDWENSRHLDVTRLLIMMIARAQKPLIITGWIVVFNMELFKSIMQTSYSFFTLITA